MRLRIYYKFQIELENKHILTFGVRIFRGASTLSSDDRDYPQTNIKYPSCSMYKGRIHSSLVIQYA